MIVYDGVKSDFLHSVEQDTIALEIEDNIRRIMGINTPQNQFRAWVNSLHYMYKVMTDAEIPANAGIAIEYNVPQTAKRVDFMISGYDTDSKPGMVIIELKQWSELTKVDSVDALVETFTGGAVRRVVHPSYQAWSYAQLISDYNATVQDKNIQLKPCAFLHNYRRSINDPLDDIQYEFYTNEAPAFTMGQVDDLRSFIKKYVKYGDDKEILYEVDNGKIRPSKSLQDSLASMIKGNDEFVMIDEQKVVYEKILAVAKQCQKDHKKRTIICQGGPGTGKSVIAINLLAKLTQYGQVVQYVSKNTAPRQVYAEKLKGTTTKKNVDNMFKGSGSYIEANNNIIHTILADEAHRLNAKSGIYRNLGENQIKEIIHAAACSVFFIDENQRVTIHDIGSVGEIKKWAEVEKSEVVEMELISQFRCNGSNGYLAWLDDVLEIRKTANYNLEGLDYDFRVCSSPHELRNLIVEKNKINNKSRILAGYCWEWPNDARRNDSNHHDIVIDDFGISWNLNNGKAFATSESSINEAGCIHTTQGLEFDYVGVIIGDDLRFENGCIVTDFNKRASTDKSLFGIKSMYRKNPEKALALADEIIKNTYRTLMTRGMKGCYVYCTDNELSKYFKKRLFMSPQTIYPFSVGETKVAAEDEEIYGKE
ncbi:DUF2075 domain-containing protein [Anaerovibrio lipolyticus]|uniref:DUF2075 domain-containing protein n=1 Tax=Anaerovibrio lipolyticus TaxID=82374 RepID=UPI000485F92F|nr:DUF2075 domain-containing protein [Anaerovibrio lipolyticus]